MVLNARRLDFPFQLGLAENVNPAIAPQGVFAALDNCYFDKTGRLVRRLGYESLLARPEPSFYDGAAFRLAEWNGIKIRIDDSSSRSDQDHGGNGYLFVNDTLVSGEWAALGPVPATSEITTEAVVNAAYTITDTGGCASLGGYTLFCATDSSFIRLYIRDAGGRISLVTTVAVATHFRPRVFRWGNRLAAACLLSATNQLQILWWDVSTALSWTVMTVANVDYQYGWDCAWATGDTELTVLCRMTGGTNAFLLSIPAGSGAVAPSATVDTTIANAVNMAAFRWDTRVIAAVANTADTRILGADAGTFANFVGPIQLSSNILKNLLILPYMGGSSFGAGRTEYHVFGSLLTTVATTPGSGLVYHATESLRFVDNGAGSKVAGVATWQGVVPLSKAFAIESDKTSAYFWAYYDNANYGAEWTDASLVWDGTATGQQRMLLLVHLSLSTTGVALIEIAGRALYRTAYGQQSVPRTTDVGEIGDAGETFVFSAPEVNSGDVRLRQDTSLTIINVSLADATRMASMVGVGDSLVFPAPRIMEYAAGSYYYIGYLRAPDQLKALQNGGLGSVAIGDYLYKVVFESVDGSNRVKRSPPSLALPFSVTIANSRIDISWECPLDSGGVAKVFRTKAGGDLFYLAATSYTATATSKTQFYDWASDSKADADLGPEILYTDSGDRPELAPLTSSVVIDHGRRLWGFNGRKLFYSKWHRSGFAPRFVETWYVDMPSDITALASQDQALVIFGEDAIWTMSGAGPDDLGVGEFDPPVRLPGNVGCPRSLGGQRSVCTFEHGTLFRSQKGIALLPRGLGEPQIVSDPVEDSLGTAAVIAATNVPSEQFVRIALADKILLWDYGSGVPGMWTTESGAKHVNIVDATLWDGLYTFAATSGSTTGFTWQEGSDYPDDAAGTPTPVTVTIQTPQLRPFGVSGDGRVFATVLEATAADGDANESPWVLTNYTLVQATWTLGQPDPDGGNNARRLNGNTAVAEHYIYRDESATMVDGLPFTYRVYLQGDEGYCWIGVGNGASVRKEVLINLETKAASKAFGADDFTYRLTHVGSDWWLCEITSVWSSTDRYATVYVAPTSTKASGGVTSAVTLYYPTGDALLVQQQLAIEASTDGLTWPVSGLRLYDVEANLGPWQYGNPVQTITGVRYRITDTIWNASSGARIDYNALGLFVADRDRRRPAGGARA